MKSQSITDYEDNLQHFERSGRPTDDEGDQSTPKMGFE